MAALLKVPVLVLVLDRLGIDVGSSTSSQEGHLESIKGDPFPERIERALAFDRSPGTEQSLWQFTTRCPQRP